MDEAIMASDYKIGDRPPFFVLKQLDRTDVISLQEMDELIC